MALLKTMRKIISLIGISIATTAMSNYSYADIHIPIYIGADVAKSSYEMKNGYGKNTFGHNPIVYDIFAGYRLPFFDENFLLEAGYEVAKTKNRTAFIGAGEALPGLVSIPNEPHEFQNVQSKMRIRGPYLVLGYDFPLFPSQSLSLTVSAGASSSTLRANFEVLAFDGVQLPPGTVVRSFSKTKAIPIVKVSLNKLFTEQFGARLNGTWKRLSSFHLKSKETPSSLTEIRLKNGYTLGLGLFYNFY